MSAVVQEQSHEVLSLDAAVLAIRTIVDHRSQVTAVDWPRCPAREGSLNGILQLANVPFPVRAHQLNNRLSPQDRRAPTARMHSQEMLRKKRYIDPSLTKRRDVDS